MSIIFLSAFFRMCPKCRLHGSICWPDGRESFPVGSKEMGYKAVEIFRDNGHLTPEESLAILEQIEESPLLREINEVDVEWFLHDESSDAPPVPEVCEESDTPSLVPNFGMMPMSMQ